MTLKNYQEKLEMFNKNLIKWKITPQLLMLLVLILTGFIFRIVGIDFGLPQHFHPDETPLIGHGYQILISGDLNPHFFSYPSLLIYINATIFAIFLFFYGSLSTSDLYIIARLIVAIFGTGTIMVTYILGKDLFNAKIGLISATIISILPLAVNDSHYATVDIPLTFFITLSILFSYYLIQNGTPKWYLFCGICIGLATSTKYSAGVMCFVVLVAFILRIKYKLKSNSYNYLKEIFFNEVPKLILTYIAILATFIVTSPYVILDYVSSLKDILYETNHLADVHYDLFFNTSSGYIYYLKTSLYTGLTPVILFLSLLGLGLFLISLSNKEVNVKKKDAIILIISWVTLYYLIIGSWELKFARYVIPLLPFLSICSAYSINWLVETLFGSFISKRYSNTNSIVNLSLVFIVFFIIISPVMSSINVDKNFITEDTRTVSIQWINSHIPYNSTIIWQVFGPDIFLLNKYYERSVFPEITPKDLNDKPDYLIFCSYSYGVNFYYPSEYGEYPQKKQIMNSEENYFKNINKTYTKVQEFYPSQVGDIQPYGVPISTINGSLVGPIIKIYKRK